MSAALRRSTARHPHQSAWFPPAPLDPGPGSRQLSRILPATGWSHSFCAVVLHCVWCSAKLHFAQSAKAYRLPD